MGERLSEVEFWDGHSLDDNCPWEKRKSVSIFDKFKFLISGEYSRSREEVKEIFNILADFIETGEGESIKKLSKGDKFVLSDFPKGTIIRFSAEWSEKSGEVGRFEDEWGIITQIRFRGKPVDVVIGYQTVELEELDSPPDWATHFFVNFELNLGEVFHARLSTATGPLRQYLARFNWVEIWQFGTGVRERKAQTEPQTESLLKPSLVQNSI